MIKFLVNVLMLFMVLFVIIIFLCACIIGVGVIDWFFDIDIKSKLKERFGERKSIKKIREGLEKIEDSIVEPVFPDYDISKTPVYPDNVKNYMARRIVEDLDLVDSLNKAKESNNEGREEN